MKTKKSKSKPQQSKEHKSKICNNDLITIANSLKGLCDSIGCTIGDLERNGKIEAAYQELDIVLKAIDDIKQTAKSLSKDNLQKILSLLHCIDEPICALQLIRDADGMEYKDDDGHSEIIDVRQSMIDILGRFLENHSGRVEVLAGELRAEWQLTYSTDYSGLEFEGKEKTITRTNKRIMSRPVTKMEIITILRLPSVYKLNKLWEQGEYEIEQVGDNPQSWKIRIDNFEDDIQKKLR